jgi:NADP-dependent 3-hydroxy acid dehydrogenase YdfG
MLEGAVAIVTGASSGIGEGLADMLAEEGVKVALVARREAELQRVAEAIRQKGGTALVAPTDLRDEAALRAMLEKTQSTLGPVDILVNAGATLHLGPIHELDVTAWDASMAINLRAPALLCAAVLPGMRERRRGYILNPLKRGRRLRL